MQEVYGPVSAFGVAALCATLTQVVKIYTGWDGWRALLVALGWNLVWQSAFHLLTFGVTPMTIYEALYYSFLGAVMSMGLYAGGKTVYGEVQARRVAALDTPSNSSFILRVKYLGKGKPLIYIDDDDVINDLGHQSPE